LSVRSDNHRGQFSRDEYDKVRRLMTDLFGTRGNCFFDIATGLWHLGRFLDDLPPISSKGNDIKTPMRRPQEVFAVGKTLSEVMQHLTGPKAIYSIPGVAPGIGGARGYKVVIDRRGRVHGYESPGGIFSKNFPGKPGQFS
jgi:hypothetical protein